MRSAQTAPRFWRNLIAAFCTLERIQFASPWHPRRGSC